MTDIELLPLPEADDSVENHAQWPIVIDSDVWLQKSVQDYARACVVHAASAKDAEIEALRTEVALLRVGAENERLHQRGLLDRERDRAERLAEALRRAEGLLRSAGIIAESDLERPHSAATEIKNALRDHDQEDEK